MPSHFKKCPQCGKTITTKDMICPYCNAFTYAKIKKLVPYLVAILVIIVGIVIIFLPEIIYGIKIMGAELIALFRFVFLIS